MYETYWCIEQPCYEYSSGWECSGEAYEALGFDENDYEVLEDADIDENGRTAWTSQNDALCGTLRPCSSNCTTVYGLSGQW